MATNISFPTYGFVNEILALSENNWRTFFKPFITDSVQSGLATIAGANMTVYVSAGECRCGAVMGILDEMIALDIANGDSTYNRIDSVIVQYTYGEPSNLAVAIVQGIPSANPVPPTLTKAYDTLWQMEIAQILVPSGATSSSEFTITDKRVIYESIESIIDNNTESEERVWSSQKTHEEIVSLSTEIYDSLNTKADAIERTVSGNIVTITDGGDNIPVKELTVGIEPVQTGTGDPSPDNIRPIYGWTGARIFKTRKNLLNPANFDSATVSVSDGVYTFDKSGYNANINTGQSGNDYTVSITYFPKLPFLQPGTYVWSYKQTSGSNMNRIWSIDNTGQKTVVTTTDLSTEDRKIYRFTITKPTMIIIVRASNTNPTVFSEPQLEVGSEFTGYEPYIGDVLSVDFPVSETVPDRTYYSGMLDVLTGEMTVTKAGHIFNGTETIGVVSNRFTYNTGDLMPLSSVTKVNAISTHYKGDTANNTYANRTTAGYTGISASQSNGAGYVHIVDNVNFSTHDATAFKAWLASQHSANTPLTVVWNLAEPVTVDLNNPNALSTLLGENHIFADTGDVEVTYRADTKLFLESQKTDAESYCDEQTTATREMITESIESAMTATKNYTTGQLIIANSTLLRATENIANGGTITIGTNAEEVDIESLIAEKTNTAVTTALQAEVTTNLELISSLARNQMSNYSAIAEIVKSGNASKVYKIGDQVMTTWNNGTTDLDLPWDIVAMRDVVNADGNTVPGMILQAHWVLPGVQFDASEASYVASAIIPAGTYYIEIGQNWGDNCKANYKYEFTTTQDVPVDGQIVITRSGNSQYTWGAPDQNPSTWVVYTFASNASITPIEGPLSLTEYTNEQTPSSTSLGTLLSSTKYSLNGINNLQRAGYGYNRWSNSAMRQWLNSDAVAGSWWTPKNPFDRQPQQLSSMRGFMAGLGSDFLSVVKPVTITTALNTISDSEIGTSETTIDTFFCSSLEEEYCVPQLAGVEGAYWPYWKERLGLNSPQASGSSNANVNHIRYLISNHSSAQPVRLRSALRGYAISTWYVGTTGLVYSHAASSHGSCPACVIC